MAQFSDAGHDLESLEFALFLLHLRSGLRNHGGREGEDINYDVYRLRRQFRIFVYRYPPLDTHGL